MKAGRLTICNARVPPANCLRDAPLSTPQNDFPKTKPKSLQLAGKIPTGGKALPQPHEKYSEKQAQTGTGGWMQHPILLISSALQCACRTSLPCWFPCILQGDYRATCGFERAGGFLGACAACQGAWQLLGIPAWPADESSSDSAPPLSLVACSRARCDTVQGTLGCLVLCVVRETSCSKNIYRLKGLYRKKKRKTGWKPREMRRWPQKGI